MDSGIPHSLLTSLGEIVFNDLSGSAAQLSGVASSVWPGPGVATGTLTQGPYAGWDLADGLPPGNGYLMQFIGGMGQPIRATVDNRPHKHGGIIHKFYAGPRYPVLDGVIVGETPEIRAVLYAYLRGFIFACLQSDARHFFDEPGFPRRFQTVRCYDATDILGPAGSPGGSPSGIAGPKQYLANFVAVNPFTYTYTETDTTIAGGASAFIPNNGTVDTWPVIEVYCVADGAGASFTLSNGTFEVEWAGALSSGHYIEVNMFNETMYLDGNSTNKISGLNDDSDFWSIPPGGCTVSVTPGASHILVKSNDAWL